MQRSEGTCGFQKLVEIQQISIERKVFVASAGIDLNAPNGASTMKDTVSGVDLLRQQERQYAVNVT